MINLKKYDLFSNLNKEQEKYINSFLNKKTYRADTNIFIEGDHSDGIYLIEDGEVVIYRVTEKGSEKIFKIMKKGEIFGEMGVIDQKPRSASARSRKDCTLLKINNQGYLKILSNNNIAINLIKIFTKRLRKADQEIQMLSFSKTKVRIKNLLTKLANQNNGKLVYENNLTHQEIAGIVGSTRETVTRLLNELKKEGYFIKKNNKIILKKINCDNHYI
ncbi:MAG: Crp/Fnr family transcriptional regulator [Halanaerobiales bacterium]|nr:Crp/Fnr family transcriptional regulator [Halanaerobiales bacterium]